FKWTGNPSNLSSLTFVLNSSEQSAHLNARGGAPRRSTTSHACSSARSVAPSASACHRVSMATKENAPATTTGRPREEDPNAHELNQLALLLLLQPIYFVRPFHSD
ncbi:hypothetical protein BHE74_00056512, partial [Ensete ventricosum]